MTCRKIQAQGLQASAKVSPTSGQATAIRPTCRRLGPLPRKNDDDQFAHGKNNNGNKRSRTRANTVPSEATAKAFHQDGFATLDAHRAPPCRGPGGSRRRRYCRGRPRSPPPVPWVDRGGGPSAWMAYGIGLMGTSQVDVQLGHAIRLQCLLRRSGPGADRPAKTSLPRISIRVPRTLPGHALEDLPQILLPPSALIRVR